MNQMSKEKTMISVISAAAQIQDMGIRHNQITVVRGVKL